MTETSNLLASDTIRRSAGAPPRIIQGGMGVAVSSWRLARAVSRQGQLGVVSGTALATVLSRRLQHGDPEGNLRRALKHFPVPAMAERILEKYFIPGGKAAGTPYRPVPMPVLNPSPALVELILVAHFVEVFLAKEGHDGVVGINFLEKIQMPTLPSIYGALLAGVDYVIMGAGIPRSIPGILDQLVRHEPVELRIDVEQGRPDEKVVNTFDPRQYMDGVLPALHRPQFIAIVSSATLAMTLAKKSSGAVNGFIVEGSTAGGHNAPPRGALQLSPEGEPVYGPRDVPELHKIAALDLPFWLAGAYGRPGQLAKAREQGAAGIQVGTAFAYCDESDLTPEVKAQVLALSREGKAQAFTDPLASPTGFPFKVVQAPGTLSDPAVYAARERICDLGFLRTVYRKPDGGLGYRCPAEPEEDYVRKGGSIEATKGRKCICNALHAAIGLGQVMKNGSVELPILTAGNDVSMIAEFLPPGRDHYTAAEVIERLLG